MIVTIITAYAVFGRRLISLPLKYDMPMRLTGAPKRWFRGALVVFALSLLMGCADGYVSFPATQGAQSVLAEDVKLIILDKQNIAEFTRSSRPSEATQLPQAKSWAYNVGPGDILSVIVFNHPELTLPAGPQRAASESGFQVGRDGTIAYPYIGNVRAEGRGVEEIRAEISERLATYIPDPQVEVRIADYNSQSIVVSGEVRTPNRQALTSVPLTLVEAINAAGGFTEGAEQRFITVQRSGRVYNVDLDGFLSAGLMQNNPVLINGDVVNVPRRRSKEAYLLGEIANPNVVDLSIEPVTLTQAISRSGGLKQPRADARGLLVFRAQGDQMYVFQLDTSSPVGLLLGTQFVLNPGDVVYALRSPLQRWNDTIVRLLPTVQSVNSVRNSLN